MNGMQPFDDLDAFVAWWLGTRAIAPPTTDAHLNYAGEIFGVSLYRHGCYQVELFNVSPNSVIEGHTHPDVDSYECYITGDIDFWVTGGKEWEFNGIRLKRVRPTETHGGNFGPSGGCFLSLQKWLNGVPPTSVLLDWDDRQGNKQGRASKVEATGGKQ